MYFLAGKIGYFPSDYVELISTPVPPPIQPRNSITKKPKVLAKALFDFAGTGPNEMKLKAGETVEVTERGAAGGWSKGLTGAFPTDYVEFLPQTAQAMASTAPSTTTTTSVGDISSAFADMDFTSPAMNTSTPATKPKPSAAARPTSVGTVNRFIYEEDNGEAEAAAVAANKPVPAKAPKPKPPKPAETVKSMDALFAQAAGNSAASTSAAATAATTTAATASVAAVKDVNPFDAFDALPVKPMTATTATATPAAAFVNPTATVQPVSTPAVSVAYNTTAPTPVVKAATATPVKAAVSAAPTVTPAKTSVFAIVRYSRTASGPTELTITEGETLLVIKQDGEWWYGSTLDAQAKSGYFPGNYVELKASSATAATPAREEFPAATSTPVMDMTSSSFPTAHQYTAAELSTVGGSVNWAIMGSGLDGTRYIYQNIDSDSIMRCPVWQLPLFTDLFADAYRRKLVDADSQLSITAIKRVGFAIDSVERALSIVNYHEQNTVPLMINAISRAVNMLKEGREVCRLIPTGANDSVQFFTFLMSFMVRVRGLRVNESMMVPTSWANDAGYQQAVLLVITKENENPEENYSIAVVNTGGNQQGTDFHPFAVDPTHGHLKRNLSMEMCKIPEGRMCNATFWFLVFRSVISDESAKGSAKVFYERVLPYLPLMPISSAQQIQAPMGVHTSFDFVDVPISGDNSFIHCVIECVRYAGRKSGLTLAQSHHLPMLVKTGFLKIALNDLYAVPQPPPVHELELVKLAIRDTANAVGAQAEGNDVTVSPNQLAANLHLIQAIKNKVAEFDDYVFPMPVFAQPLDESIPGICGWDLFGRMRRDCSVEGLAGDAPVPPIMRPIELTLVPDKATHFLEVTKAMRHCLNLCVLLSNQRKLVRNSYTLRLCLIEHLFVRVIPLPLHVNHPLRNAQCFWHAQQMRYETQADIMRLLNMLCRHFATASLSVKTTRSGDAVRMLVFACMATICDATMRKTACDIPSYSSLHYAGTAKGPVKPFGFDLGNFAEESEYLKFSTPETTAARTQVLDYFFQLKSIIPPENWLFRFQDGLQMSNADKRYIDQLCLQMGFTRGMECTYITGSNSLILDHYPEIGFFRDLVFMFKLVMVPTSDKLPILKPWTPEEVALEWMVVNDDFYQIRGFNKVLDCTQPVVTVEEDQVQRTVNNRGVISRLMKYIGIKGKLPRATPSQANPSILLGERVDTEDDILHITKLPDFEGTLGAKDCELMLQYLTAPYMRIPLLLKFFSSEARLKALRTFKIQEVIDAALFEPGQWQELEVRNTPMEVPAPSRDHLCTPTGLLFNELIMAPNIVFSAVYDMLDKVVEMDTGKYSELSESILYVTRLAVRIEGYILFLIRNNHFHANNVGTEETRAKYNGAYYEANVRGLEADEDTLSVAIECQKKLRKILDERVFRILARWIKKAKTDGKMHIACMLHAHLAFLYRNVQIEDLTPTIVFSLLSCQIFLFNNYKYDLDLELKSGKTERTRKDDNEDIKDNLGIPQVDLFDMFQVNRVKIMNWLLNNANIDEKNMVMDAIVQLVEEGKKRFISDNENENPDVRTVRNWVSIEQAGINFRGRFVPDNEFDPTSFDSSLSPEAKVNFEAWLRETTTLAVNTEINVQLGEFTIKKHVTQPLDTEIQEHDDFISVFQHLTHDDIIQCAEVKHTTNRKWLRLVGLGHDVQLWNRDIRIPILPNGREYNAMSAPQWLQDIIEPWKNMVLSGVELFITSGDVATANQATLYGFTTSKIEDPNFIPTLKEVRVYRYPRVLHIFNIVEHGRRWYRSMIFSSDAVCTLHKLPMETFFIDGRMFQCCGNPKVKVERTTSLVITRYLNEEDVSAAQTYIPHRMMYGLIPTVLLENYNFWQNADDSITGYMPSNNNTHQSRSIVNIRLQKQEAVDVTGFGFSHATATVCRIYTQEDSNIRDFSFYTTPDPEKAPMFMVDLMAVLTSYYGANHSLSRPFGAPNVAKEFLQFDNEARTLHALIHLLLRLEPLSHMIAWSKTDPGFHASVGVDLIELPRLRLSFEKTIAPDGSVKFMCLEHSGHHLAACTQDLKFRSILDGLPNAVLLANQDNEYSVLIPATVRPGLVSNAKMSFKLTCSMMDQNWIDATGDSTYFLYPVHSSGCFMSSRSIAATLYLVVLRLMTRNYTEAYRLIESCVCDRPLTPQEQQIFELIGNNPDALLADAYACRLKFYFVTFGCSDIMPYKFNIEEDIYNYITNYRLVSSNCRLTADEEVFIMSHIPTTSHARTNTFLNRERIIKASFDLTFEQYISKQHTKNITPVYPKEHTFPSFNSEKLDLELLNVDLPSFKNVLQKLTFVNYKRPEPVTGPECITYLNKIYEKEKNLGFFVLYEMMMGGLQISIFQDQDKAMNVASVLLHTLPENYITGLQRVLLYLMETHPELAVQMPLFEDKRKLKLPSLAGLDIFQTHIKTVATFCKTNRSSININKLLWNIPEPYQAPVIIHASDIVDDTPTFTSGRSWMNHRIMDFTCEKRVVTHAVIPPLLQSFTTHYTAQQIQYLAGTPLDEIDLKRFIEFKNLSSRGEAAVSSSSPLRVLNHPSSRSHIARTSVVRLESDIVDFSVDENASELPIMKAVGVSVLEKRESLEGAVGEMFKLISSLMKLRDSDTAFVRTAMTDLLAYTNGSHVMYRQSLRAQSHLIRQESGFEAALVRLFECF